MRELSAENSQIVERDEELMSYRSGHISCVLLLCFCRRPESGYMLQCGLCNEWYHASCLHLPKGKQGSVEKDSRFVCNLCVCTKVGWPGVPAHISQEGPRGDNGGAGAPVPGGEGHCLAEEGQGVHCGGWGGSGDGEAAAVWDGGAEGQHQTMEGRGRV